MIGERLAQRVAVVVVARDRVDRDGERREELAHARVRARVSVLGEIAGDEHGVGLRVERDERRDRRLERAGGAEVVRAGLQVQVGDLGEEDGLYAGVAGATSRRRSMAGS